MIAVAAHHSGYVAVRPCVKEPVIIVRIFPMDPAVKCLVEHENPQPVAGVEKCGRRGIVAGANGIESKSFHQFHATFLSPVNGRCPERTVVVVQTPAF